MIELIALVWIAGLVCYFITKDFDGAWVACLVVPAGYTLLLLAGWTLVQLSI